MEFPSLTESEAERNLRREQELIQRWATSRELCGKWHNRVKRYQRLYDLDHYRRPQKAGERRITLSTYTNTVDLTVGILTANAMVFDVDSFHQTKEMKRRASLVEQLLDGIIYVNSERQETDLRYDWTLNQARDGAVALRTYWDPAFDATLREIQVQDDNGDPKTIAVFDQLPLVVEVIPAEYIFPVGGGKLGRWTAVFYAVERTVAEVENEVGWELLEHRQRTQSEKEIIKGEFVDYWGEVQTPLTRCPDCGNTRPDPVGVCLQCGSDERPLLERDRESGEPLLTWRIESGVMFEQRMLRPPRVMPGYDDNPYTLMFYKPVGRRKPEDWGHSVLRPIEKLVPEIEFRWNRQTRLTNMYSSLPLIVKSRENRKVNISAVFGDVPQLRTDESIEFPRWPGTPPDFRDQMNRLEMEIDEGSYPASTFGQGSEAASGYALSQLNDSARIRLTQPTTQQQRALAIWARKTLRLLQNFAPNQAVQVYGALHRQPYTALVSGADTQGVRVQVRIKPRFPQDEVRKVAMGTQTKGSLSLETRMERYYDIDQPDQEVERMMQEKIELHPLMVEYQMIKLLKRQAESGDPYAALLLERIQRDGLKQPSGSTPGPNAPEQLPGQPAQLPGQFTQQEQGFAPPGQEPMQEPAAVTNDMTGGAMTP